MRFSELLAAAGIEPARRRGDADVTRITTDSRRCGAGFCFLAVRGTAADGHRFIRDAVQAGAAAVVCEEPAAVPEGVAFAAVADSRAAAGPIAQAACGWPARRLTNIGVTGTNGKTTIVHLIHAVLSATGGRPGLIGTVQYDTGVRTAQAAQTTPGAADLAEMMAEMVQAGRTHAVMEVSSHALDQSRTAGIDFQVGVFSNLSGDHLDYHHTMPEYFAAKRRLFEGLAPSAAAVVNIDDLRGQQLADATQAGVIRYGLGPTAELRGFIRDRSTAGTTFRVTWRGQAQDVSTALIGDHNVLNCLAAAGACLAVGTSLSAIGEALAAAPCVRGRLQRVEVDAPFQVFVDYAHTDDALANVLSALRRLTRGRLIVVFGCGGDRDSSKRPRMAEAVEKWADRILVTSDNPRTEDPDEIIRQIAAGFGPAARNRIVYERNRREAIRLAVDLAAAGDTVLIAGKGHETYQIVGTNRLRFDDVETAEEMIRRRKVSRPRSSGWGPPEEARP